MNAPNGVARILLIADDPDGGLLYRAALAAGGYQVVQAQSFIEAFDSSMIDPDVIVLCELAMFAYPAQQVLRIPTAMTPAALVVEVHRRLALRAALHATIAQAA
ncbi:MAG: response regulator transcription factor [Chloroflexi bacterium]|nr:MAG: response regulator transcription factor [Chloroflexota bacterium]